MAATTTKDEAAALLLPVSSSKQILLVLVVASLLFGEPAAAAKSLASRCEPVCGTGGRCIAGWVTYYCQCSAGFGPGNAQSCCRLDCNSTGHGKCGAPDSTSNGEGRCVCSDGYSGDSCGSSSTNLACELQLESSCGAERKQGSFECASCAGVHAPVIHSKNCTNEEVETFCSNQSCVSRLADKCRTSTGNASCFDCAKCAATNRKATECQPTDEEAFCGVFANTSTAPATVSCGGALAQLCGDEQKSSFFDCVKCSGVHAQAVTHVANCTNDDITQFCQKKKSCYSDLQQACSHTLRGGSCGACASCVTNQMHHANRCTTQQLRQYCESECASQYWNFTATGAHCALRPHVPHTLEAATGNSLAP